MKALKITTHLLLLSSLITLSACTGMAYSSHFDCPYGEGAGCASLSKVNKMIDQHQINLEEDICSENGSGKCAGGSCKSNVRQVYIYYGPDQMSKIITIEGPQGQIT